MELTAKRLHNILLICGIIAPLIYIATDTLAGTLYSEYNFIDQAISELLAINAPTSDLVVPLFTLYDSFLIAFAFGVWSSADRNRYLHVMALLIIGNAVTGLMLWNIFPMHMRGVEATFTDTMHIVLSGIGVIFILLAVIIGSFTLGKRFRLFSIVTILLFLAPSILVFALSPSITQFLGKTVDMPPLTGISERISTYVYMLWQVILTIVLLKSEKKPRVAGNRDAQFTG
jgi:hypothetical protein